MEFRKGNFEKQIDKLPQKVIWCKKCVISNQRPSSTVEFKNKKNDKNNYKKILFG